MIATLEDEIEQDVVDIAEQHDWVARKLQWVGRKGAPDQAFFGYGRCVIIEFKAPGKVPTGQQKKELKRLQDRYSEVYVCDSREAALDILCIPHAESLL